jgi:hypothetical protein
VGMSQFRLPIIFFLVIATLYSDSISGVFVINDIFLVRDNHFIKSFLNLISYLTSGTESLGRPVRLLSFYLETALFWQNHHGVSYRKYF